MQLAHSSLTGKKLTVAAVAVALATFMAVLDTTIANVSLPAIAGDMAVPPHQGTWVLIVFIIASVITLPLTGWLTQRFGMARLFVYSVWGFTLTSLMCGLAQTFEILLFSRFLQGAVSGPMIPLSQALLLSIYPKEKAGQALAIWSMTAVVAPVLGPICGGIITDEYSWPWIFYINVPVGVFVALVCWHIFRFRETPTQKLPVDIMGLILLAVWVCALQVMLEKGLELGWFSSDIILLLAAVALFGFLAFVVWELNHPLPIVQLRLFSRRSFSLSVISLGVGYGLFLASVVVLPLWLQTFMGYTATWAGYATAPIGVLAVVLSPWVGRQVGKIDSRILASASFIIFIVAMLMRTRYNVEADLLTIMLPQIIQGAAIALFFAPLTNLSLNGLKSNEIPLASGLSNFTRITCGAIAISISMTFWDTRAAFHYSRIMESINIERLNNFHGNIIFSSAPEASVIEKMVHEQATILSMNDFFYIQSIGFMFLILITWGIPSPQTRRA